MKRIFAIPFLVILLTACSTTPGPKAQPTATDPKTPTGIHLVIDEAYAKNDTGTEKAVIIEGNLRAPPAFMINAVFIPSTLSFYAPNGQLLQTTPGSTVFAAGDFLDSYTRYEHFRMVALHVPKEAAFVSVSAQSWTSERAAIYESDGAQYESRTAPASN